MPLPRRILLLPLLLGACVGDDFARPGTWQATGVNDANLRAMLADPTHAVRGAAAADTRGAAAAAPVTRLLQDRRAPLPPRESGRGGGLLGGGGGDGR